jgi:arginase
VCIVWFDAHGDINTPDTTRSGYLGGLVLTGAAGHWDSGLGGDLDLKDVVLVGARDLDPAETVLIDAGATTLVTAGPNLAQRLRSAIADRAIYVHIDCDVLEPGLVPTEYRVPGGLTFDDLRDACRVLAGNQVVGLEIAELEAAPGDARVASSIAGLLDALEPLITRIAHR